MLRRWIAVSSLAMAACVFLASCATNPYTGRDQFTLLSEQDELQLGAQAYQEALAGEKKITDDVEYHGRVERVARRLAAVMDRGWDNIPPPRFEWEFHTVDEPGTVNAWCLPGGKICVYTGIFPACMDDNGLAVVMGHEIMHAVLHHGNERISQNMVAGIAGTVLAEALGGDDEKNKEMVAGLFGIAVGVGVLLPFSREHETEADEQGLYLAARAGYDPQAGIEVWKRMESMGGGGTPEFLSTHPSHGTRIENMQKWMPRAQQHFRDAPKQQTAALPAPGHARIAAWPTEHGHAAASQAGYAEVEEGEGKEKRKRHVGVLEFRVDRSLYVEEAAVDGPGGYRQKVEGKTGVPGGDTRQIALEGKGGKPAPAGKYRVLLTGKIDGRPWEQEVVFDLR